jgi:hypothetical protein
VLVRVQSLTSRRAMWKGYHMNCRRLVGNAVLKKRASALISTGSVSDLVGLHCYAPQWNAPLFPGSAGTAPQQSSSAGVPCLPAMSALARKDQAAKRLKMAQSTRRVPPRGTMGLSALIAGGTPVIPRHLAAHSAQIGLKPQIEIKLFLPLRRRVKHSPRPAAIP